MRVACLALVATQDDIEDEMNHLVPRGYAVRGLRLHDWGAEANLTTPFGTVAVQVKCTMEEDRLLMEVAAAWWVPIPSALLGQIVRRAVDGIPGVESDGVRLRLDLPALAGERVSADLWDIVFGEEKWVINARGVEIARDLPMWAAGRPQNGSDKDSVRTTEEDTLA